MTGVNTVLYAASTYMLVPLLLDHLGHERYGLWVNLGSVLAWLTLLDLGITNGIVVRLTTALANSDAGRGRAYVTSAFWLLSIIASSTAFAAWFVVPWIDWQSVLRIGSPRSAAEFGDSIYLLAGLLLITLPCALVSRILLAMQKGYLAGALGIFYTVASVGGVLIAIRLDAGLFGIVLGYFGGQAIATFASSLAVFCRSARAVAPRWPSTRMRFSGMSDAALPFFLMQLSTLLLFQSGDLIISRVLGPEFVAPYKIAALLFYPITIPQQLLCAHLWAVVGEANARNDVDWIRRALRRVVLTSLLIGIPIVSALTIFAEPLVNAWTGGTAMPSTSLLVWMAAWTILQLAFQPLVAFLIGMGAVRIYAYWNLAAAMTAVLLALIFVGTYGSSAVVAAMVVAVGALSLVPAMVFVRRKLRLRAEPPARKAMLMPT